MANRFWVGGTGTWDSSSTTHWSTTSGGANGASVPGSSDVAVFDANSGGGTVTLNFGGTITVQGITTGAFTGTWDNSVNNNNITMSAQTAFNGSGTGTRTIKLGSATYTWSFAGTGGTGFSFGVATNLTLIGGSETWVISGASQTSKSLNTGGKSMGSLTVNANCGVVVLSGTTTLAAITLNAGTALQLSTSGVTATSLSVAGSSSAPVLLLSTTLGTQAPLTITSGTQSLSWAALRDINCTGGATFTASNSSDLGNNSGITITAPVTGASRARSYAGL